MLGHILIHKTDAIEDHGAAGMLREVLVGKPLVPSFVYMMPELYPSRRHPEDLFAARHFFALRLAGEHIHAMRGIDSGDIASYLADNRINGPGGIIRVHIAKFAAVNDENLVGLFFGLLNPVRKLLLKLPGDLVQARGGKIKLLGIQKALFFQMV